MNHRAQTNPEIPAAFKAATLQMIANHFDPGEKTCIIAPSSKERGHWATFLRQLADDFDDSRDPDAVAAEFEVAQAAQDYAGGDDGYDDDGEVMG